MIQDKIIERLAIGLIALFIVWVLAFFIPVPFSDMSSGVIIFTFGAIIWEIRKDRKKND